MCEATDWLISDTPTAERIVELMCVPLAGGEARPATIEIYTDLLDDELAFIAGHTGLYLSFFNEVVDRTAIFALRDQDGELLILSYADRVGQPDEAPLLVADMSRPWYLGADPAKQAAWNDPFGDIFVRHVGCAERDGTRPLIETEVPWVLEFESDEGLQQLHDQSNAQVQVDEQPYHLLVSAAFDGVYDEDSMASGTRMIIADYLIVRALE